MRSLKIKIPFQPKIPFTSRRLFLFYWHINRKAPEAWEQLKTKQLKQLVAIVNNESLITDEVKLKICMLLYSLKKWHIWLFEPEQMHELIKKCDWVFDTPFTAQLLPVIKIGRAKLYGPGKGLDFYTGREFEVADTYFMNYLESGDQESLHKFIAVLYRPKAKMRYSNGDLRKPYFHYQLEERSQLVSFIPAWQKQAIVLWYKGCRSEWEEIWPELFSGEEGEESNGTQWHEVLMRIAGGKFGTYNETIDTEVEKLFTQMELDVKDHKRQQNKQALTN